MKKIKLLLLNITESVVIRMINIMSNVDNKCNKRAFKLLIKDLYWLQIFTGDAARELEATL